VRLETDVGNDHVVPVDHRDPTPLYVQLAGVLRAEIAAGKLAPHDPVPSESYLVQEHGVSRSTARKAIALLRDDGLVYTLPQRGSFVAERS
jgi:GntR family transcriptional regulator